MVPQHPRRKLVLMKVLLEPRTYEERDGEWVVVHPVHRSPLRAGLAKLAASALAIAAIAVIGTVAALVGLVLLPIGLLATVAALGASAKAR
jgi:hypothetical protein